MAVLYSDKYVSASNPTGPSASVASGIDPHDKRALMIVTAHGSALYNAGGSQPAGILVTLTGRTGGSAHVIKSDSVVARANNITFNASTTMTMVVEPNQVAQVFANVDPYGDSAHLNIDARIEMHVVAIDI